VSSRMRRVQSCLVVVLTLGVMGVSLRFAPAPGAAAATGPCSVPTTTELRRTTQCLGGASVRTRGSLTSISDLLDWG